MMERSLLSRHKKTLRQRMILYRPRFIRIRSLRRQADRVSEALAPEIRQAKEARNKEELDELRQREMHEISPYLDEASALETEELCARAKKQLVPVPARDYWVDDEIRPDSSWDRGDFGDVFLRKSVYDKLAKEVRDAERESRKHTIDVLSIIFSGVALVVSVWNVFNTQKRVGGMEARIDGLASIISTVEGKLDVLLRSSVPANRSTEGPKTTEVDEKK